VALVPAAAVFAGTTLLIGPAFVVGASVAVRWRAGFLVAPVFSGTPVLSGAPVTA